MKYVNVLSVSTCAHSGVFMASGVYALFITQEKQCITPY